MGRRGFSLVCVALIAGIFVPAASQQNNPGGTSASATSTATPTEKTIVDYYADVSTKRSAEDSIIYLVDNVAFHHNGTFIQCDSALRYDDYHLEGFGQVLINKDSTFIYGDRISYNGNTNVATVYSPIIKLVNGDLTMWVNDQIEFDTQTAVGSYSRGAVITQRDNLMESDRGLYFGDSSMIVFAGNVAMRNDNYLIKTDSIGYNLDQERVTFLTWTYIWDKERDFLLAQEGDYLRQSETYHFTRNAYAMTPDQEFWADTMNYATIERLVTMLGNIQILDTAQRSIALGDEGYYSDSLKRGMLTRLPAVIGYEEAGMEPDSAFTRADSLFFDTYPVGTMKPLPVQKIDTVLVDSMLVDSLLTDSMLVDSLLVDSLLTDSMLVLAQKMDAISIDSVAVDSAITTPPKDTLERVIRAYYNARSFRSDIQAIADSIISYSADSSASLYGDPIIWNGDNQLTANRINIYSANEQIEYAEYIGTPFITQRVEHADSLFNQAQSRYMESWFRGNEIVRALMTGNVQNYYYSGQEGFPPDQFATMMASDLTIDFEDREPVRLKWGPGEGVLYPIDSIPATQPQRLEGFSWAPELKPADRYAITLRGVRPSARERVRGYTQPLFVIDERLRQRREALEKRGVWRDRFEPLRVSSETFRQSGLLF